MTREEFNLLTNDEKWEAYRTLLRSTVTERVTSSGNASFVTQRWITVPSCEPVTGNLNAVTVNPAWRDYPSEDK